MIQMTDDEFKAFLYRHTGYKQPSKQVAVLKARGIPAELNANKTVACAPEWILERDRIPAEPIRPRPTLQLTKRNAQTAHQR